MDAMCIGVVAVTGSVPGMVTVPLYCSNTILPFLATIIPPLNAWDFKTVSNQRSAAFLYLAASCSESGPGGGNSIMPELSFAACLLLEAELQPILNIAAAKGTAYLYIEKVLVLNRFEIDLKACIIN